jgi:hypothetical protein
MKKTPVLIFSFVLLAAASAEAEFHIGLTGGFSLTTEKNYGGGAAFGLSVGMDVNKNFAVELSAMRLQYPVKGSSEGLSKGKLAAFPIELLIKARLPFGSQSFTPYVAIGGGYFLNRFSLDSIMDKNWADINFRITEKAEGSAGFCAAAGIEVPLGRPLLVNLEARYNLTRSTGSWTFADLKSGEEVSGKLEKLNLDTLILGLGLKYSF